MHHITMPDETTLYVKDWGAGEPVILLAGWPFGADSWDDQAVVIAGSGDRVIAHDRRGFGRSSQPWGGYDYDTLADDLSAFGVPTLIIHGTADRTVPIAAAGRAAHAGIALSTLVEYEGAPHGLFASHKHRLSEDLLGFIRG